PMTSSPTATIGPMTGWDVSRTHSRKSTYHEKATSGCGPSAFSIAPWANPATASPTSTSPSARTQPTFPSPVRLYCASPQSQNFQVMLPPKTLPHPAWNHSQPSHSRATSQIHAAVLEPKSQRETAGSSMSTVPRTGVADAWAMTSPLGSVQTCRPERYPPCTRSRRRVPDGRSQQQGQVSTDVVDHVVAGAASALGDG